MNELLLPKKYLSSSQVELWEKNPARYRYEYFENGKRLETIYLKFGSRIHKMIEDGSHEEMLPGLPTYPERELRITTEVRGVPVLAYLDGNDPERNEFGDYKTGKTPWTQSKLQKAEQMLFYAVILRIRQGRIPSRCGLHWIETRDDGGDETGAFRNDKTVALTGKYESLYRTFDERELDRMEEKIVRVAREISDAYREFINEI